MLFALDPSELETLKQFPLDAEFVGAQMLIVRFRTDPAVVEEVLPNGLHPGAEPSGVAFVASYPETNFDCVYNEGALFLECERKGERGLYCLAMPVDDDIAMISGREIHGFPKKMAEDIRLERTGSRVVGSVTRRGIEIIRIEAELEGPAGTRELGLIGPPVTDEQGRPAREVASFLYKYFPSTDRKSFDYIPRLVRQSTLMRPRPGLERGRSTLQLGHSTRDPLGDIPVREVTDTYFGVFDNTMLPGAVVGHAWNMPHFVPHAFFKTDVIACQLARAREEGSHATLEIEATG
jgi:acetoacetate decarboxylase